MNVQIRAMNSEEQGQWIRLGQECYQDRPELQFANVVFPPVDTLAPSKDVIRLGAFASDRPIGRALVVKASTGGAYIYDIGVLPTARRQGVGRALLGKAEEIAQTWGEGYLTLPYPVDDYEEARPLRDFLRACEYGEQECYSVMIDLTKPLPKSALERAERALKEGFEVQRMSNSLEDVKIISELQVRYFPDWPSCMLPEPWTMERVVAESWSGDTAANVVAFQQGKPVGLVGGFHDCSTREGRFRGVPGEGLLSTVGVDEDVRQHGVATQMCVKLIEILREAGNQRLCYGGVGMGSVSMRLAEKTLGGRVIYTYALTKPLQVKETG